MLGLSITPSKQIFNVFNCSNRHFNVLEVTLLHNSIEWLPSIKTSGSTIGTKLFSWHSDAYLANALQFEIIHALEGILSPIVITALHLQNFAPSDSYLTSLSLRPSSPSVIFSLG